MSKDERYYHPDGRLKFGTPVNVGHLILQLQTLDPEMKVSSVTSVDIGRERKGRAYGLSMSRERWDENGWLDFTLAGPECLAIWANPPEVENLRKALEPFARRAGRTMYMGCPISDEVVLEPDFGLSAAEPDDITVGDLRNAARALEGKPLIKEG